MSRTARRAIALLLGCALAAPVGVVGAVTVPIVKHRLALRLPGEFEPEVTLHLDDSAETCRPDRPDELRVERADGARLREPIAAKTFDPLAGVFGADFSGHWAETRRVAVVAERDSARVEVAYRTDYGDFAGAIDRHRSSVRLDEQRLCFDLAVLRLDGSAAEERWLGSLELR